MFRSDEEVFLTNRKTFESRKKGKPVEQSREESKRILSPFGRYALDVRLRERWKALLPEMAGQARHDAIAHPQDVNGIT